LTTIIASTLAVLSGILKSIFFSQTVCKLPGKVSVN